MALQKYIKLDNGVTVTYHKVGEAKLIGIIKQLRQLLTALLIQKQELLANFQPTIFTFGFSDDSFIFTSKGCMQEELYKHLKTLDMFLKCNRFIIKGGGITVETYIKPNYTV